MAIEKLPAAPVNLSGGSLLSRQASNIPEGGTALTEVAQSALRAFEPGFKRQAEEQALTDVARIGVVRGPDGAYERPPEPTGGDAYNAVYTKAIEQAYTAAIGYDFQMKADKIVADNYQDPDRAIVLMEATLSGMTKGMDPRYAQTLTPLLQSELQQRAYGVRNRKASNDLEAVIRTNTTAAQSALASLEQAILVGDPARMEFYTNEYKNVTENLIRLNYYNESGRQAIDDKIALTIASGERRREIENRAAKREALMLQKLEQDLADENTSSENYANFFRAIPTLTTDEVANFKLVMEDVPGVLVSIPITRMENGKVIEETFQLDAVTARQLIPNADKFSRLRGSVSALHSRNVAAANEIERRRKENEVVVGLQEKIRSGNLVNPTSKEQEFIDSYFETLNGKDYDFSNPDIQAKNIEYAREIGAANTATIGFMEMAANSTDLTTVRNGLAMYQALKYQRRGNVDIGSVHLSRLTPQVREIYDTVSHWDKVPGFSDGAKLAALDALRKGNLPTREQLRSQYTGPGQSYEATALAALKEELGFNLDEDFLPPKEIEDQYDRTIRAMSMSGSVGTAVSDAAKSIASRYKKDERAFRNLGPTNFDSIVPPDAIERLSVQIPELAGRTLGKDVVYDIVEESRDGRFTFRVLLKDGKKFDVPKGGDIIIDPSIAFKKQATAAPALTPQAATEAIAAAAERKREFVRGFVPPDARAGYMVDGKPLE